VATSPRGFPLGEHGVVGGHGSGLYGELTRVPWLARWPDGVGRAVRAQDLVQPADLFATVANWLQLPVPSPSWSRDIRLLAESPDQPRGWDRAVVFSGTQRRLHVPYWAADLDTGPSTRLFVKPDDRWEVNDVAVRCPQVVAEAQQACAEFEQAACDGNWSQVSDLPARLAEPTE
jgi:hypothetical protein